MVASDLAAPIWVDQAGALRSLVEQLNRQPILAVDTESNSLFAYREQVCLVQFSEPQHDYLIDPLRIQDLSALGPLFANPAIEKVFHAAEYDVICLKRDFGFTFANLFDTMQAARILGRPAVGLGAMLESEFGIALDKRYQRADWGQRPLPPAQLSYARLDTHYLIGLRDRLKAELEQEGRWELAQEDFYRLTLVAGNGRSPNDWQDACLRISGAQDLSPRQLAILLALCHFREEQARQLNRPVFKVLGNQALIEIARAAPAELDALSGLPEMTERNLQRYGRALLEAVRKGLEADPPHRSSGNGRPDDLYLNRLDALRSWRKATAQKMGVESDIVLPRDTMFAIADKNPRDLQTLGDIMHDLPWRFDRFGRQILEKIQAR